MALIKLQDSAASAQDTDFNTQWTGLNPHLIAKIFPVDNKGNRIDGKEVHAPLADGATIEISMNWQSPFENSGAESVTPALTQMLQSGALSSIFNAIEGQAESSGLIAQANTFLAQFDEIGSISSVSEWSSKYEGKTGMTKLNSTQIFTGAMPVRISCSAIFRAFKDPVNEVERPVSQLFQWTLPKHLQSDGIIAGLISGGTEGLISGLFPSDVPQMIGIQYKGRTLAPLVIESISEPMDSPIDSDGNYVSMEIPLTIASLTALDKDDWSSSKTSSKL